MTRNPVLHRVRRQKERRLAVADPTWQLANAVAVAIGVGIVYFLAARLSLSLLTKPDGVAVFWPASGVAAGALIALGPRAKWPVAIGAAAATIAANLLGDRTLAGAVTFALCNAGEALLAAGLIERQFGSGFALDRLRQVLGIAGGSGLRECYLGNWWSSGVQVVSLLDCVEFDHLAALVRIRRARHCDGCAAADRSCRGRARPSTAERDPRRRRSTCRDNGDESRLLSFYRAYHLRLLCRFALLFPLLLWLAARCRPVFAAAAAFVVALTIVWTTTFGIGYFGDPDLPINDRIVGAQAGILTTSLCTLVLVALFAERRQQEAALSEGAARLEQALRRGGDRFRVGCPHRLHRIAARTLRIFLDTIRKRP